MWNVKTESDTSNNRGTWKHNHLYSRSTWATYLEGAKSSDNIKEPHLALHTYFRN